MRFLIATVLILSLSAPASAESYVCAEVMPECDNDGNVEAIFSTPESPCYYYYSSLCLSQKLEEISEEKKTYQKKVKKLRKKLKRYR